METKKEKRYKRHKRIRSRVIGTKECPRVSVFRSNSHIYVQLIDDDSGKTLVSANDVEIKKDKLNKTDKANQVGLLIAEKASGKKIKKVVFDRGGYNYHGRVKAVAEGARKGGLKF